MLYMKYHNFKKVKDHWKILRVINNNVGLTKKSWISTEFIILLPWFLFSFSWLKRYLKNPLQCKLNCVSNGSLASHDRFDFLAYRKASYKLTFGDQTTVRTKYVQLLKALSIKRIYLITAKQTTHKRRRNDVVFTLGLDVYAHT